MNSTTSARTSPKQKTAPNKNPNASANSNNKCTNSSKKPKLNSPPSEEKIKKLPFQSLPTFQIFSKAFDLEKRLTIPTKLPYSEWRAIAEAHTTEVKRWTQPYRSRIAAHQKHPVFDFLFTYYPFSMGRLEQWHPGFGISLEITQPLLDCLKGKHYQEKDSVVTLALKTLSEKERFRLHHIHNLLVATQSRPGNFSCFGMHEWAMVYQGGNDRHREDAPLRLTQKEIDHLVESRPLCCSHFDAVRFIPPSAQVFNKLQPSLNQRHEFEQPGCLHSNMDLYKWASKSMPWVGSHLLWKCFQLALTARELDMRASVYDLTQYGYTAIRMETPEGREIYEKLQRQIAQQATPLRKELIYVLAQILREPSTQSKHLTHA